MSETAVISPLLMDRSEPVGNSTDPTGRRALHVMATMGTAAVPFDYDEGAVTYPSTTTEVYTYKKAGTTLRTVTITYTDTTKNYIAGWVIA